MKKSIVLSLGVCLALSQSAFAQINLSLYSGYASTPPTIDGVVNLDEYATAARVSINALDEIAPGVSTTDSTVVGGPNGDGKQSVEDSSALVYIMNDDDNFYLAFDITDDTIDVSQANNYQCDGVEIRIDALNAHTGARVDGVDVYPTLRADGVTGDFNADISESAATIKDDGTGYMVEFRVDSSTFASVIGFDVAINDSDDPASANRDAQYRWTGFDDSGWNNRAHWGYVTLAKGPGNGDTGRLVSGQATTTPTLDGMLDDGEYAGALMIDFDANDEMRFGVSTTDSTVVGGPFGDGKQIYEDSHATVYVMNDLENFYVAIDVTDDVLDFSQANTYQSDAAEFRIDTNFNKSADREDGIDIFPTVVGNSGASSGDGWEAIGVEKSDGTGFIVEFRADMSLMAPVIGFDIAINDSDDPAQANRDAQYRIYGINDAAWNDPFNWAELVLYSSGVDSAEWEQY
ncbi:hypothetical protein K8I31_18105 [bacterium]|nr:hypothetical protein [bacterium]